MSKTALYKGLSAGLMTFGQGMAQQIAMDAERRRKESLLALERQWQLQDREEERDYQNTLYERQRTDAEIDRRAAFADEMMLAGLQRQYDEEDASRVSPVDQARIGLLEAQAGELANRTGDPDAPFDLGKLNPSSFTPQSIANALELQEGGASDAEVWRALETRQDGFGQGVQRDLRVSAIEAAEQITSGDLFDPVEYGLPEGTTRAQATDILAQQFYNRRLQAPQAGDLTMSDIQNPSGGGDGSMNSPIDAETVDELEAGKYYMVLDRDGNPITVRYDGRQFIRVSQ